MTKDKIKTLKNLKVSINQAKAEGKSIVFTNGCFDLLHVGHVSYLEKAAALGTILVVAINSDDSVRKLKGRGRPLYSERERALVLAALECVDYVTVFKEKTPSRVIKALKPNILVKGGDWSLKSIVGKTFVEAYGGKVASLPFVKGFSTTALITKMKNIEQRNS